MCAGNVQLYSGHRRVHICTLACNSWEFKRNKFWKKFIISTLCKILWVELDVKNETYDEKYIDVGNDVDGMKEDT